MPKLLLVLEVEGREALEARTRSRSGRVDEARRAWVTLMLAEGQTTRSIAAAVGSILAYIAR